MPPIANLGDLAHLHLLLNHFPTIGTVLGLGLLLLGFYSEGPGATASTGSGATEAIKQFVLTNPWVWPTCETLHFVGMSLMFGVLMIVNLRLLGAMNGMSYASVHRLLPLGILGFG